MQETKHICKPVNDRPKGVPNSMKIPGLALAYAVLDSPCLVLSGHLCLGGCMAYQTKWTDRSGKNDGLRP